MEYKLVWKIKDNVHVDVLPATRWVSGPYMIVDMFNNVSLFKEYEKHVDDLGVFKTFSDAALAAEKDIQK